MISFPPPKFSTPCTTFLSRRRAPPPLVVPLYATPFIRELSPPLPAHRALPERALYHPYAHARRERARPQPTPIDVNLVSTSSSNTPLSTMERSTSSSTTTADSSGTESIPSSPLTPLAAPVLISPPQVEGALSVNNVGWHEAEQVAYREIAKKAIQQHLDFKLALSSQAKASREAAIKAIEEELPALENHQGHWGAITLLRDQLKSIKDTTAKREKRAKRTNAKPSGATAS